MMRYDQPSPSAPARYGPPAPKSYPIGWYFVVTAQGSIGLVNHTNRGPIQLGTGEAVQRATFIASSNATILDITSMTPLINNLINASQNAGTPKQLETFRDQLDVASGKNPNLHELLVKPSGKPNAASTGGISTKPSGDAADASVGGGLAQSIADAITSPLDFLKMVAWLFHPLNILRAVECLWGGVLMIVGVWISLRATRTGRQVTNPIRRLRRTL